jgi:hypothetical protein
LPKLGPANYWKDENNQKEFFLQFAKTNNFDPLISHNWYSFNPSDFAQYKVRRRERERRVEER